MTQITEPSFEGEGWSTRELFQAPARKAGVVDRPIKPRTAKATGPVKWMLIAAPPPSDSDSCSGWRRVRTADAIRRRRPIGAKSRITTYSISTREGGYINKNTQYTKAMEILCTHAALGVQFHLNLQEI